MKPGGVIPPSGFGYFDVILDKCCLFAVFNQSFNSICLCLSEMFGRNLSPHPAYHHQDSPSKLITRGSIRKRSSWRLYVFHWQGIRNARKKCLVISISVDFSTTVTHGSQTVFELMMMLYMTEKLFIK